MCAQRLDVPSADAPLRMLPHVDGRATDKTTCGSSVQHRRQHACRITQNELRIQKSCKFIFFIQCESTPIRIFHLEHRSQCNPAPGKRLAKLRYMAGHFLPAARITGVPRRFCDMSATQLQYMQGKMDRRGVFERVRKVPSYLISACCRKRWRPEERPAPSAGPKSAFNLPQTAVMSVVLAEFLLYIISQCGNQDVG